MIKRVALLSLILLCGFAAGLVVTGRMHSSSELDARDNVAATTPTPAPAQTGRALSSPGQAPDFAEIAARTVHAVVNISAIQVARSPRMNDPMFRFFFGDDPDMFARRGQSAGSGVIVSSDGYVLTNQHVIGDNVEAITVVLSDQRERRARIVGVDTLTDLAVLKIEGRGLPTIAWGDSARLRVAEWVLAIGNQYQIGQTVTLGIVSAVGRNNVNLSSYEEFIQTDAAINPGNSGGALINGRGELVGINTSIFTVTGGYQGIGFAVPSNLARRVMSELIDHGEVRRGNIGSIRVVALNDQLVEELQLDDKKGALVWEMRRDSTAFAGGLRPGDVVEAVNGQPTEDPQQFWRAVHSAPPGSTATLTVNRGGRRLDLKVAVEGQGSVQRRRI
jgi:Do/DeqQ family serine protease